MLDIAKSSQAKKGYNDASQKKIASFRRFTLLILG